MFFTRQNTSAGPLAIFANTLPLLSDSSESVWNSFSALICPSPVGNRGGQCRKAGFVAPDKRGGSKPHSRALAQHFFDMKNAQKATGIGASDRVSLGDAIPNINPETIEFSENPTFSHPPAPRQPESPEVESLRSVLKANMPRETASPALLKRIKSRIQEHKR
jgi:hypothetical protein